FSNPPELKGEMFSYLPLSVGTNLGVHLSGNFSLSSARSNILHDFLEAETDDARWNRYILCEILPELHAKLIDQVVIQLIEAKLNREQTNVMPHHLWPIKKDTTGTYKDYGLNVIKRLGLNGQKVLWTEANGGQFVSLQSAKIINEDEPIVADILAKLGVLVVKLDKVQLQQLEEIKELNLQYTILNGKLTCEELQRKNLKLPSLIKEQTRDSLFKLLKFVLQDQSSYNFLNGLSLVPLSDGSVGTFGDGQYVGEQAHLALFPKIGPSKFIIDLSDDFPKIFTSQEFSEATRIKKFDASAILDLLAYEIPLEDIDWDPKGKLVPNKPWLEKIWSILTKEAGNVEFDKLSLFPLLSMTKPSNKLIKPNPSNPLLHDNGHFLIPILVKLKVRFTDMKVFESDEKLEQCILECNPINIINSLVKTCSSLSLNMKELFENSKLTPSEYKKFREFLINHGIIQEDFLSIRSSLPIWPIQNCEDKFIDAKSGILLPFDLPFFTFSKNTNFYKCELENENLALVSLNAKVITELQYVKKYLLPDFEIHSIPKDCEGYIPLLKKLLSLKNFDIEYLLKNKKVIPNKSLSAFVSANELYDKNVSIFGSIFEDSDKFLPIELLQDSVHLGRLKRIGLKHQMNYDTFIECTQEIVLQITNQVDSARNRAKILVRYLYEHVDILRFNPGQWDEILEIKFVPSEISEASLSRQFYKMPKETTGFESFRTLRLHKYKNVCWTRCPLFDENLEPTEPFNKRHPEIGIPTPEDIMEHWFVVVDKIEFWKTFKGDKEIKDVIKEIYEKMDHHSRDEKHKLSIQLNIDNDKRKLFLNKKEDPFDPNNWAFGKDLVFDLEDDVREVSEWLKPFKHLLLLGGAQEVKGLEKSNNVTEHKQNEFLINALLNKLTDKSGHELYDVFFIVGKEKERIGANRFVLSAASAYFEKMFCGNFSESAEKVIEIPMIDENIQPEVFRMFLRWLYGQRLVEAIKSVLRKKEEFTNEQESYETYYLDSLVHLLKVTDIYGVEPLKDEIVNIIKHDCIRICNVLEIKEWAINCNAPRLTESCKEYIILNERLVLEQNKENCAMAEDED
ncbi:15846_t:CDS:2, partial [Funneliformis caledonium]